MVNMNKRRLGILVLALIAAMIFIPLCLASSADDEAVAVKTAWSVDRARPGDSILLAIVIDIKKGFHINADERQIKSFEDFKPIPTKASIIEAPDAITIEPPGTRRQYRLRRNMQPVI